MNVFITLVATLSDFSDQKYKKTELVDFLSLQGLFLPSSIKYV